jgi:hypothetical protein
MLGPNGVITVESSFEQAYYYEQDCVAQAATLSALAVMQEGCQRREESRRWPHLTNRAPTRHLTQLATVIA